MATETTKVSITVDADLKREFLTAARANSCSGAQILRFFMLAMVEGRSDPARLQNEVQMIAANPAPAGAPKAAFQLTRRIAADMLGLAVNA